MASRTSCFTIGDLMLLDPPTLLVTMILAILATSSSYLVIWLQDRRQYAMPWMMAATLLAAASFAARILLPNAPAIILTNPVMLAAAGCMWMSCRALTGKRILLWALVLPGLVWVGLCCLPVFMAQSGIRVAVANLIMAPSYGLAAFELWRLKGEAKVARWWLIGVLGLQGLIALSFGLFRAIDPGPNQDNYISFTTFPLMALSAQGFVLLMSFGMIALVKERAAHRDRQAASSDALTGLANRRRLDEALELAFRDTRQGGRPLALIMVDADAFKAYNDLYGHPQGDACLCAIAGALRSGVVRKQDLVARYGGEEFAVLLPDTDMDAAERVAERLRLAVRRLRLHHAGREGGIATISLGIAVTTPDRPILSTDELLRAADGALYRAKRAGRDCIARHDGDDPVAEALPSSHLRLISDTLHKDPRGMDQRR